METVIVAISGLSAGLITAAGIFALITSIRIVNRFTIVTRTGKYTHLFENLVIVGVTVGNIMAVYDVVIPWGTIGVGLYGILSGMYVGCFAVALAETIQVIPILVRRGRLKEGMGIIIICMALGKAIGGLFYFFS